MKFISWNVNGLRACLKKGFEDVFNALDADFFCIQETKMQPGQADFARGLHRVHLQRRQKGLLRHGHLGQNACALGALWPRRGHPQPRGPRHHAGIPGFLSGQSLRAQLPERAGAHSLPYAVGGRPAPLSAKAGRRKACHPLRRLERGA